MTITATEPATTTTGPATTTTGPDEGAAATGGPDAGAGDLVLEELLVEEISIDGMCGVY